jgi:uncharacterized protein YegP (UPF0339 family)
VAAEFEVFKREDGQWDWRLKSSNGQVLGGSAQGYTERNDAIEGLQTSVSAIVNDILVLGSVDGLEGAMFLVPVGDPEDPDATFELAFTEPTPEDAVEIVE